MTPMTDEKRLYLKEWRDYRAMTHEELGARVSRHPSIISKLERGKTGTTMHTLRALAEALDTQVERLFSPPPSGIAEAGNQATIHQFPTPAQAKSEVRLADVPLPLRSAMPRDVPVLGTAAGSLKGAFVMDGAIDYVRRPPGLDGAAQAYSFYVEGDSMFPEHKPGELRFVHPGRPVHIGDTVVLQIRTNPNEPIQAFIKTLRRRSDAMITVEQLNPPITIEFARATVVAMHKVLTLNDLFEV